VGYVSVVPKVVTIPLDAVLDINQFIQACPAGAPLTAITLVQVDPGIVLQMAYGVGLPKQVFQGQCFTFGNVGECVGAMDAGLAFGSNVAVSGGTVQVELSFYNPAIGGGVASAIASQ
jgi:hypothetical protein